MRSLKLVPSCCCDDPPCPYCVAGEDVFEDASIAANWQGSGSWEEIAGVVRTDSEEATLIWAYEIPCTTDEVVEVGLGSFGDGNQAYIFICWDNTRGFLYARFTKRVSAATFDVAIGENEDVLNFPAGNSDLETLDDTSLPSDVRLCYDRWLNKLTLTSSTGTILLEGHPTWTPTGRMGGVGTGVVVTPATKVSFGYFRIASRGDDCRDCPANNDGGCKDCCNDGAPDSVDLEIADVEDSFCEDCSELNDTFNLTVRTAGFGSSGGLASNCLNDFNFGPIQNLINDNEPGSGTCILYGYDVAMANCDACFAARAYLEKQTNEETEEEECRMVVILALIASEGGGAAATVNVAALYLSDWEEIDDCAAKEWTCTLVDTYLYPVPPGAGLRCAFPDSVGVTAV